MLHAVLLLQQSGVALESWTNVQEQERRKNKERVIQGRWGHTAKKHAASLPVEQKQIMGFQRLPAVSKHVSHGTPDA